MKVLSGWLTLGILLFSVSAPAETLDDIKKRGVLRWGADAEGGAPYVFLDPTDNETKIGFEVDIAQALAREWGVRSEFVQNSFDGLIPALNRGNYDIALNGLEITADRAEIVHFSNPYYVSPLQIVVKRGRKDIQCLPDLKKRVVGTLKASFAERLLHDASDIEVRSYDGQINPYEDLSLGRLDAVVMDYPISLYYGRPNTKLDEVGCFLGEVHYGVALRKEDTELLQAVNQTLDKLIKNGTLRKIYEDWGMWNGPTAKTFGDRRPQTRPSSRYEEYVKNFNQSLSWGASLSRYADYLPVLLDGALMTLAISLLAMIFAIVLGGVLALVRQYGPRWAQKATIVYIEVIRGTPLLIQLYLIFYGLPNIGISLSPFVAAVCGLALNYGAYEAENYRAGLQAVASHQMEAALSLGLSRRQSLRYVIVPQAIRVVIPPVTNDFISLFKDSSLVSVITMVELTKAYGMLAAANYDYIGLGLLTAALYFLIGYPFTFLARRVEKRLAVYLR